MTNHTKSYKSYPHNLYYEKGGCEREDNHLYQPRGSKKFRRLSGKNKTSSARQVSFNRNSHKRVFGEGEKMMEINRESLSNFLSLIEFKLKDGEEETYSKKYRKHNAYEIVIKVNRNFKSSLIDYGNKINVGRRTITNFSKPENFVILECVDRL